MEFDRVRNLRKIRNIICILWKIIYRRDQKLDVLQIKTKRNQKRRRWMCPEDTQIFIEEIEFGKMKSGEKLGQKELWFRR